MNLKYLKCIVQPETGEANNDLIERIDAIAYSPNNQKLAICGKDRFIYFYDEKGDLRDKFPTRSTEPKSGNNSEGYRVTAIAFSADSTKLAVAQTDSMIFIYKIGDDFKQKKSIVHKLPQPSSVLTLVWPSEFEVYCGLLDGKIRYIPILPSKTPRSKTIYNPDSFNIALATNSSGKLLASSHVNNQIGLFSIGEPEGPTILSSPSYALALGVEHLLAATSDKKILVYDRNGVLKQTFDFSRDEKEKDWSCACSNPTGQMVLFGGFERIRILQWVPRKKAWEEGSLKDLSNFYLITGASWKKDGTRIALGNSAGGLFLFESILKRSKTKKMELTYVSPSHVVLKMAESGVEASMKSKYSSEILDVKVMGKDRYAIAQSMESIIICDMDTNLQSEIPWSAGGDDKERFYFDNPNICMIFHQGEMIIIEFGRDEILGNFRTEFVNPHVISVRVNERIPKGQEGSKNYPNNKKLAYLVDLKTISIVDLEYGLTLGHVSHDSKIDWLELNETGNKLLYRDRRSKLTLVDVDSLSKTTLLQTSNFVQWVPGSDVIAAQCKKNLCIWYNVNTPAHFIETEIRGVAFDVVKNKDGQLVILTQDGQSITEIPLDESRIEFGTAIEDGDLIRAMMFLESLKESHLQQELMPIETVAMWKVLAKKAFESKQLAIAERAYCAAGDYAKAKFLRETLVLALRAERDLEVEPGNGMGYYKVLARCAILEGDLKLAEAIYLGNNDSDAALKMYEILHKYEDAISLAKAKNLPQCKRITEEYMNYLMSSGQEEVAAEFMERNEDYLIAIKLYIQGGLPTKAAKILEKNPQMDTNDLRDVVTSSLLSGDFYEEAGDLQESLGYPDSALDYFKKGKCFEKATRLAKNQFPDEVVTLEESWGDYLVSNRQLEAATNHFIEAGKLIKALDAAIDSRQWKKSIQIIEAIDEQSLVKKQYLKLADHYFSGGELSIAENCFVRAGEPQKAVDMYNSKGQWENAIRISKKSLGSGKSASKEMQAQYMDQAEILQNQGKLNQAEKLYMAIGQVDTAISMYAKKKMYDDMVRLVSAYHPEHIVETHKHVANLLKNEDNLKGAENHYLKAGEFNSALFMYQERGLWEDAYKVARTHGGVNSGKEVVFLWAQSLGGETAVRLLKKFGCLMECIDYMCHQNQFQFAMDLAKAGAPDRIQEVQILFGKHCEALENFEEAEREYISAKCPREAVEMYLRIGMMEKAIEVAETHAKVELQRVLLIHAKALFEQAQYPHFESVVLRAEKPEFGINLYKSSGLWTEAFTLCRDYAPSYMGQLQNDYDQESAKDSSNRDSDTILSQAKEFERMGDYKRAIDTFLQLNQSNLDSQASLIKYWSKAGDLAVKFLRPDAAERVLRALGPMLQSVDGFTQASMLYLEANLQHEALDALIEGGLWTEAKRMGKELGPRMEEYVKKKHTELLKRTGQVDQLEDVSLAAALDLLCEQGQWVKCLERAKKQDNYLHHYMGKYVIHLLKERQGPEALQIYSQYGVVLSKNHFPLYKGIANLLFLSSDSSSYELWAMLRSLFFELTNSLAESEIGAETFDLFERLLLISHYYANRAVFRETKGLEFLAAKVSVSLLRYSNFIPVDRSFYEAGIDCKKVKWDNMAFIFMNHYLDIHDAIEEETKTTAGLDNSDFVDTDIPTVCDLPGNVQILEGEYDELKEWVLAASMDRNIQHELRVDDRGIYEASLRGKAGEVYEPCLVSGYPVLGPKVQFRIEGRMANKEDWNKLMVVSKGGNSPHISDILNFITKWCGSNPSYLFN